MPKRIFFIVPFLFLISGECFAFAKGQWIWNRKDLKIYKQSQKQFPKLIPTVWTATFFCANKTVTKKLALSPDIVQTKASVLIRINESCHDYIKNNRISEISKKLNDNFEILFKHFEFFEISEIQIDYDCPVALLKKWSQVLGILRKDIFKNKTIWITSLVWHLQDPKFSENFFGKVDGHILQLFDMGIDVEVNTVFELLKKQDLPVRIGLGAFERQSAKRQTNHRKWFQHIKNFAKLSHFKGLWIFPATKEWYGFVERHL